MPPWIPPRMPKTDGRHSLLGQGLTLAGLVLVAVGVSLPWVGDTQLQVYVLGMESGLERVWGRRLLLGVALAAVLVMASLRSPRRWAAVAPLTSVLGIAIALIAVATTPLTGPRPAAAGVYVTLAGGLLVAAAPFVALAGAYVRQLVPPTRPRPE